MVGLRGPPPEVPVSRMAGCSRTDYSPLESSTLPASGVGPADGASIWPIYLIWSIHMKTTVEIAEDLFMRSRNVARREGTTLRALIEEGLQAVLDRRRDQQESYRWPDLSVGGEGLAPDIGEGTVELIRGRVYAGQGA